MFYQVSMQMSILKEKKKYEDEEIHDKYLNE